MHHKSYKGSLCGFFQWQISVQQLILLHTHWLLNQWLLTTEFMATNFEPFTCCCYIKASNCLISDIISSNLTAGIFYRWATKGVTFMQGDKVCLTGGLPLYLIDVLVIYIFMDLALGMGALQWWKRKSFSRVCQHGNKQMVFIFYCTFESKP